jgi:DNA-binding IclR family transcriptional regulator
MALEPTLIVSVRRALHLLDAVGEAGRPLPAKALARRADLPLATTYHLLRTLVHEGYLARVEGVGYVLGDHVAELLDGPARQGLRAARQREILVGLRDELSAAAYLSVLTDGEIRLVDVADSAAAPRVDLWVGFEDAAHATAVGKAVLAVLRPGDRLDYLGRHGMADLTPRTVTDRRVLLHQLETQPVYALDREEYALGTACIAVSIPGAPEPAAVAVSVPSGQVGRIVGRADELRRAAERLGLALSA